LINMDKYFMQQAVVEAARGMENNEGGPFGAVIVHDGKIVARAHNRVIVSFDPTAHAEILVIRQASQKLGRFDLSDCELYTTCEPCPMCLAAVYWARIKSVFYGCSKEDAAAIDFADKHIYQVFSDPEAITELVSRQIEREQCLELFQAWAKKTDKIMY